MIRILWKRKLFVVAFCLAAFIFLELFLSDQAYYKETDAILRQLQAVSPGSEKDKADNQDTKQQGKQPSPDPPPVTTRRPPIPPKQDLPSAAPTLMGDWPMDSPAVPGIYNYLPHLKDKASLLSPALALSKGKTNVSIVIGIPSIRRPLSTYLYDTLQSLVSGMTEAERADTLIIVCVTEPWNVTYQTEVKTKLQEKFPKELREGLLELIVPRAGYYPQLATLPLTLGDKPERVRWRSKQNLDYAFLMMHAWTRGQYYLQLEDDVVASKGYITSMKRAIAANRGDWVLLEFSVLGFIGRLFHSSSVPSILEFLLMFYASKPCDWLMDDYLQVRQCGHGEKWAKCLYKIRSVARPVRPSLFQHAGYRSSLQGHVNKLKDKHFNSTSKGETTRPNPPVANIWTSLKAYANDVYDAYMGGIFWATNPKEGDIIEFMYYPGLNVERIRITTGDDRHPHDILTDAVVEILPETILSRSFSVQDTKDVKHKVHKNAWTERTSVIPELEELLKDAARCETAFNTVGTFDATGVADIAMPASTGPIWSIRIRVTAPSKTWLIVNKVNITAAPGS